MCVCREGGLITIYLVVGQEHMLRVSILVVFLKDLPVRPMYIGFRGMGSGDALYHSLLVICWNWVLNVCCQAVLKEWMEGTVCAQSIRALNFCGLRDPGVIRKY